MVFDIGDVVVDLAQKLLLNLAAGIAAEDRRENRIDDVVQDLALSVLNLYSSMDFAP